MLRQDRSSVSVGERGEPEPKHVEVIVQQPGESQISVPDGLAVPVPLVIPELAVRFEQARETDHRHPFLAVAPGDLKKLPHCRDGLLEGQRRLFSALPVARHVSRRALAGLR